MKKTKIYSIQYSILLFLLSLIFLHSNVNALQKTTRIALVNPNLGGLENLIHLVENNIIDLPNPEFIAVVYSESRRDYAAMENFLTKEDHPYITLRKVDGMLTEDNLFQNNPCTEQFYQIFRDTDSAFFLGGDDISPSIYHQKTRTLTGITDLYRHYFEISFLFHLIGGSRNEEVIPFLEEDRDYAIIGFCLGMQSMNVAAGGAMFQDIPRDIYDLEYVEDVLALDSDKQHRNYHRNLYPLEDVMWQHFHRIHFVDDSFILDELGMKSDIQPRVLSSHHQAVKSLGKGFRIDATSLDGKVIEMIRHEQYPNVIGVQFHPEFHELYDHAAPERKISIDDTSAQNMFQRLQGDNSPLFHKNLWHYINKIFR